MIWALRKFTFHFQSKLQNVVLFTELGSFAETLNQNYKRKRRKLAARVCEFLRSKIRIFQIFHGNESS